MTDNGFSIELYRRMRRIRTFEERVGELFVRQQSAGSMLHLSIGEEASAVGVAAAMREGDTFTTHHRGHGVFLARGADPNRMMAEIAGKEAGYCRGKGGSMHIADMRLGHLGANAIVGGGIPAVVGAGLAHKRAGKGEVSIAFFGDGAMQQGILYESMNMVALWKLPVVFCCINNQWGMGTRIDRAAASTRFQDRATAFGLEAAIAEGADIHDTVEKAARIIGGAREGKPGFISVECYRFFGHARMDKSPYRDEAEEAEGRRRDPIARLRDSLPEATAELDRIDADAATEMNAAIEFAVSAAPPGAALTFRDVYADDEPAPQPMRQRLAEILG